MCGFEYSRKYLSISGLTSVLASIGKKWENSLHEEKCHGWHLFVLTSQEETLEIRNILGPQAFKERHLRYLTVHKSHFVMMYAYGGFLFKSLKYSMQSLDMAMKMWDFIRTHAKTLTYFKILRNWNNLLTSRIHKYWFTWRLVFISIVDLTNIITHLWI